MYAACPNYTTLGCFYKHARFMKTILMNNLLVYNGAPMVQIYFNSFI